MIELGDILHDVERMRVVQVSPSRETCVATSTERPARPFSWKTYTLAEAERLKES